MPAQHTAGWTRRRFLGGLTVAGAAGLLGLRPRPIAAEPPPETTRLRLMYDASICTAPQYVAEALLKAEGFAEVEYVKVRAGGEFVQALAAGHIDLMLMFAGPGVVALDAGHPIVFLAGMHVGCLELFGTDRIHAIRDLKGKTVAVGGLGAPGHVFLASLLAYVGLDPRKDIHWVTPAHEEWGRLLAEGTIDAIVAFPPLAQELRGQQIGHVVVNSSVDRPWSQYFCCMVGGNRAFVQQHRVATKRALRALLKATDVCALEPEQVARFLVEKGYAERYDYALQTMNDVPYGQWREYDSEDTVRWYALRLHEVGMIKSSPQKLIVQGTDWRFLNDLKKELKA